MPCTCGNCFYFIPDVDDRSQGDCHRYPPTPAFDPEDGDIASLRPLVSVDEVACGEHKEQKGNA